MAVAASAALLFLRRLLTFVRSLLPCFAVLCIAGQSTLPSAAAFSSPPFCLLAVPSHRARMRVAIYSHSIAPSIDGVCRRFTGFLHELSRSKHSTLLFTLEEDPQDIPADITVVSLDYMYFPTYPEKKVAKPTLQSFLKIMKALREFAPQVEHYHCVHIPFALISPPSSPLLPCQRALTHLRCR